MTTRTIITQVQLKNQVEPSFQSPRRMNHHNPNLRMSGVRLARVRQVDWASRAGKGKGGAGNLAGLSWFCIFALVILVCTCIFLFVFRAGNSADASQIYVSFLYLCFSICILVFVFRAGLELWRATQFISTLPGCLDLMLRRRGG